MSGTYAEPGSWDFRTDRTQLIFECHYCGTAIALDDDMRDASWHHQTTGDAKCAPLSRLLADTA